MEGNPLTFVDPAGLQAITLPVGPALASAARPSGLGTLVDPVVAPISTPNDPNNNGQESEKCRSLKNKIESLKSEVFDKRIPDLAANPGNLPLRLGPGEQLRDTVRGHEKLLNRQWRRLNELEDQYRRECPC